MITQRNIGKVSLVRLPGVVPRILGVHPVGVGVLDGGETHGLHEGVHLPHCTVVDFRRHRDLISMCFNGIE